MAETHLTTYRADYSLERGDTIEYVDAGGSSVRATITSGASQVVTDGGKSKDAMVINAACQVISQGGTAIGTTLDHGSQIIRQGGTAIDTTVNKGLQSALRGGVTTGTVLNGGLQYVEEGGQATGTVINKFFQEVRGVAIDTVVNYNGEQYIQKGGRATGTVVSTVGLVHVHAGGSALDARLAADARLWVDIAGGLTTVVSGTHAGSAFSLNANNGVAEGAFTLHSGWNLSVDSGGVISGVTVKSGGNLGVADGEANDVRLEAGARFVTTVVAGANMEVNGTSAGSGFARQVQDGVATGHVVCAGLDQFVYSGGSAVNTLVSSGGKQTVGYHGSARSTTVNSGGAQIVTNHGQATSTTVNAGGWQILSRDGQANSTTVKAGGWLEVWNGGTAFDATVLAGGRFGVFAGGSASGGTVESGAAFYAGNGARITNLTVNDGALQYVDSGAVVNNGSLSGINGRWWAQGDTPQGYTGPLYMRGAQYVAGVASGMYILGQQYVVPGGQTLYCTVGAGGSQVLTQGGQARNTTVLAGGHQFVVGGVARDTTINGGTQHVSGGMASKTIINANGWQKIHAGVVSATMVNKGGTMRVDKGGIARVTTVANGGMFSATAGAVVSGLTMNAGAKAMLAGGNTLYAANTFTGATVTGSTRARPVKLANTATLTLGGKNTMTATHIAPNAGHINITGVTNKVGSLNLAAGSRVTYDVSKLRAAGNTLMLQLSARNTQKRGAFSVSVGKAQTSGVYELSRNVTQNRGMAYTVKLGNARLGTIKLGGTALTRNGATYKLAAKGNQINLTIGTKAGRMLKGNARANTLKGTAHCDVFYGGKGNDKIHGGNGRDVAVYNKTHWGKDIIAKTNGAMTLLFNGLKAKDIVQKTSGKNLVITRKGAAGQSITIQGYNAATHKIVFGSGLKAVDKYLAAARPTGAQTNAARNQIWKKAGLA